MKFSLPPSKLQDQQAFDYYALPLHDRDYLQQKTSKIKSLVQKTAEVVRELGKDLAEVRSFLRHNKAGGFDGWLQLEFQWKRRTAYNYIAVYETFGNCVNLAQLAPSVLYLLASPSTPEEARHEALERAAQGEVITYALAKQIRSHHTIDVEAEVVEDNEKSPAPIQPAPVLNPQSQPEPVIGPLPPTTEPETQSKIMTDAAPRPSKAELAPEELESLAQREPAPAADFKVDDHIHIERSQNKHYNHKPANVVRVNSRPKTLALPVEGSPPQNTGTRSVQRCTKVEAPASFQFEVGDRVRILRRQHGEDNWAGKTARIWQITSDGWLRVDVEGHKGVKFTLKPNWVEPMPELSPEQQDVQPEPVLDEGWADEPDPESPAISDIPLQAQVQGEAHPRFQAGDRLQVTNLGQQNQQWSGEVAEVLEVTEAEIKVTVRLPRQPI